MVVIPGQDISQPTSAQDGQAKQDCAQTRTIQDYTRVRNRQ